MPLSACLRLGGSEIATVDTGEYVDLPGSYPGRSGNAS